MISEYYSQGANDLTYDPNYYKYDQYGNNPGGIRTGELSLCAVRLNSQPLSMIFCRKTQGLSESEPDNIISPASVTIIQRLSTLSVSHPAREGSVERTVRGHDLFIIPGFLSPIIYATCK